MAKVAAKRLVKRVRLALAIAAFPERASQVQPELGRLGIGRSRRLKQGHGFSRSPISQASNG